MTETSVLWLIGTLVIFLAALVGIIYSNVLKHQDKADDRLQKAKDEAAVQHKDMWDAINLIKERLHIIDTGHVVLCGKHEQTARDVKEVEDGLYKCKTQLAELKYGFERYQRETDNSLKVFADIVKDMKK